MKNNSIYTIKKIATKKAPATPEKAESTALTLEEKEAQRDAEIDALWNFPGVSNILSF